MTHGKILLYLFKYDIKIKSHMRKINFKTCAYLFGIVSSESALKILLVLNTRGKVCVSEISRELKLSISATSHQLQKLEASGLVVSERQGRTIYYKLLKKKFILDLVRCAHQLLLPKK